MDGVWFIHGGHRSVCLDDSSTAQGADTEQKHGDEWNVYSRPRNLKGRASAVVASLSVPRVGFSLFFHIGAFAHCQVHLHPRIVHLFIDRVRQMCLPLGGCRVLRRRNETLHPKKARHCWQAPCHSATLTGGASYRDINVILPHGKPQPS